MSDASHPLAGGSDTAPMRSLTARTDGRTTGNSRPVSVGPVRIKVLGPLEVAVDGDRLALGGPQQRLVLAILVSRADATVPTDSLISALWRDEDPPNRARKTVQVYVANLRKALGGEQAPIESATGGYVLRTGAATVDAVDFEAAVSAPGAVIDTDARQAVERLSAALALWSGTPYADLGDAAALTPEITRLNELRLTALERRLDAALTLGHHRQVLSELDTLTTDHPYREGFTALRMLALYRSGRQAEALRAYQRTRLVLGEELGIDPSPQVRALEQSILNQDPSLDLPTDPVTAVPTSPAEFRADTRSIRGYELRQQLDETGDAALWRAYQPATGREVTLRIFGPDVANESTFVKRFERETQLVAQLEHPHLVSIYDFWRDPGGAYVVMPLLRGGTLADSLRRGRWKMSAALRMLDQIGSALAALHRHGLNHGSLGPDCVFLDSDGNAYLADAGITGRPAIPSGRPVESEGVEKVPTELDVGDLAALLTLTVAPGDVPAELTAVFDRAHDHDRVEDLLRSVRQVMGSDAVGVASESVSEARVASNPYKGLRAFQETDAADFFGREVLVSRLVETVAGRPLTTVVGSSGSGKSSVVKAGLIPAIRGGALDGDWLVAEMFPGSFPFEELEAALSKVAVDRPDGLMADLTADDRGMLRVIKRVLPDDGTGLLLVIDQFEELFSLTPDEETRRLFLANLVTLGSDARSQVRTVVTLRADFFDRPLDYPEFAELVHSGLVTVAMPDQDSLAMMVSRPARQAGLDLEPGLVTEVVRDVMEQPGGLPLMQYALTELAERSDGRTLTTEGYRESGGVLGALGQRAEEIFQGLQPSARDVAERIFLRLVTVDEHADDTRRRIRRTELNALGLDRNAVDAVLHQFGSFRLLSFDHDPTTRGPTVEVAHEALIREWPRLRSWVDDRRQDLLLERRLREAVVEWEASDRDPGYLLRGGRLEQFETWADGSPTQATHDERRLIAESRVAADTEREAERRRIRRLRRLVAVVGVALVAAVVAGAVAFRQQAQAESAAEEAELATLISRSAAQSREDPELSVLLALEAYRRAPVAETEQAVLNALGSSANANRVAILEPVLDLSGPCPIATISSDGLTGTAVVDGRLFSRDMTSGAVTDNGPSPTPCGRWIGDEVADRVVVESENGLRHWFGPYGGPLVETDFGQRSFRVLDSFRPNNRLVYVIVRENDDLVTLRNDTTGEQVGAPVGEGIGGFLVTADATSDGSRVAIAFETDDGPDRGGRIFVLDGETGEEILDLSSPVAAASLIFDDARGQLIAGLYDGTILVIDTETGKIVSEVGSTTTARFLDLGVRDDGVVIAVSESQVELVDRSSGPVGTAVELRDPREARIRADGTVLIVSSDGRAETIDLESNTLVEQTWEVDPSAHTAFDGGFAGAMVPTERVPVVVDLATGATSTYGLRTPTGEQFPAIKIYPEPDGIWAFSADNVMARWEGEEMVEQLDLGGTHMTRTQFGDLIAVLSERRDGADVVDLVSVERGATRVVFRVAAPGGREVHPSVDGGLHVIEADGTLLTYDSTGALIGEIETGVEQVGFIAVDPASGKVALAAVPRELVIVDPGTGAVNPLPDVGTISTLGFGRDGELLALTGRDGTVRLWDVERGQYAGLVWNGSGQVSTGSPSWYDEATESMWVASSGKYLQIPLNPERWVERACEIVSRDLTQEEWDRFVPGNEPLRSTCP
jgi:DNA-binding SARP family transcriptional activator/DNA-binding beta-propeller fold protein YncE